MDKGLFRIPEPASEPIKSYAPGSPERRTLKVELARQRGETLEIPAVIGGRRLYSKQTVDVISPHAKRTVLARLHQVGADDVAAAITAAAKGRAEWAALPWNARAAVYLKAGELVAGKYRDLLNAATMLGQSKTVFQAEIDSACEVADFFRFNPFFMQKIYTEQPLSPPGQWNYLAARPLEGFVYAVTPFNFTALSLNLPAAPALMGCSVVWKPAANASLAAYLGLTILEEAGLPPGVINFVPGDAETVSRVALGHRDMAGLHFTGSTATFNLLWRQIGERLDAYRSYPRIVGETGGKDFVFAHPSADPEAVAVALVRGAFEYQGQKCSAASRAYLPASLWPKIRERLLSLTAELKVGDVEDFTNFMGAVIDQRAFDRIKGYLALARHDSDAKVLIGGEADDQTGFFVAPTVVQVTNPHHRLMAEEIFGPVLTVYVYADDALEETARLCDQTSPYALTGAIFARDRVAIETLATWLENAAGNFYINDKPTGAAVGQQPFGGARKSGTNDKAGSLFNLLRWVSHRTVKETLVSPTAVSYPFMQEP